MKRTQRAAQQWWVDLECSDTLRARLLAQFTITRDGYARWYKGATRAVCGRLTPPGEVEDRWAEKKRQINQAEADSIADIGARSVVTYRQALSGFLADCEMRVQTGKPKPMKPRTLHNYTEQLNDFGDFVGGGMPLEQISPEQFTEYARKFSHMKASGFDSVVTRVGALFNWAVEMEYIDRYRPGPVFQRPPKQQIRQDRLGRVRAFTAAEVAKMWLAANNTMKCWIGLGVCAGFINSDVANVPRGCLDLETGIADFRRRKMGQIRRVCPLPAEVLTELRAYVRPDPADDDYADLFFLTRRGMPYSHTRKSDGKPSATISRLMANLLESTEISTTGDGRNFAGLRTTFYNLAPKSGYEIERAIIMGRAQGTIDLDHYLESFEMERLRHVVTHVWDQITKEISIARADGCSLSGPSVASSPNP